MSFDIKEFKTAKFKARTEDVPVPELADFFTGLAEKEVPVWQIRGLAGNEVGFCNEAGARNKKAGEILEGLLSDSGKDAAKSVKDLLGFNGDVPKDIAVRISRLVCGSVKPEVDQEMAVRICRVAPGIFFVLTNKIVTLTGLGHVPGKPKASGEKKK